MHERLVAGLSGLVTCLQSNFIGTNFAGFCSNLGVRGLFSAPFVSYWAHIGWLAPGYLMGAGNPTISRKPKPRSRPPASPGSPTIASLSPSGGCRRTIVLDHRGGVFLPASWSDLFHLGGESQRSLCLSSVCAPERQCGGLKLSHRKQQTPLATWNPDTTSLYMCNRDVPCLSFSYSPVVTVSVANPRFPLEGWEWSIRKENSSFSS